MYVCMYVCMCNMEGRMHRRTFTEEGAGGDARLVFITHHAVESAVQATVQRLRELPVVRRVGGLLRVVGLDAG